MDNNAVKDSKYPYTGQQGSSCSASDYDSTPAKVDEWRTLTQYDTEQMKRAIATQPIAVGVYADDSFMNYGGDIYDTELPRLCKFKADHCMNHAVTLIGYGVDETTKSEYWILRNSWGTAWGEDGYMKVLIDDTDLGIAAINTNAFVPLVKSAGSDSGAANIFGLGSTFVAIFAAFLSF